MFSRVELELHHNPSPKPSSLFLSSTQCFLSCHSFEFHKIADTLVGLRCQIPMFHDASIAPGIRSTIIEPSFRSLNRGYLVSASISNSEANLNRSRKKITAIDGLDPFRGKSGSVSFIGLTHQMVEEGQLESAPFDKSAGSLFWLLGPVALIVSLLLPRIIAIGTSGLLRDEILLEISALFFSEVMFYAGLGTFLLVTDHAQKPYLEFSPKRWGLITGLKGYLISDNITSCIKVFLPGLAAYLTWPLVAWPALVSVAPFFAGCLGRKFFEGTLHKRKSSCWPLLAILFDIYRLFQLSRAGNFLDKLNVLSEASSCFSRRDAKKALSF